MIFATLLAQVVPLLIKMLVDRALVNKNFTMLNIFAVSGAFLMFLKGGFSYGQIFFISYVVQKTIEDLRNDIFNKLQYLSLSFYDRSKTGELMSRITNDVSVIQTFITAGVVDLIKVPVGLISGFAVIIYLSWKLTILSVICLPLIAYLISLSGKKMRKVGGQMQTKLANMNTILQETLSSIHIVKSFVMEEYEINKFAQENKENFRATMRSVRLHAAVTPLVELLGALGVIIVLWIGGRETIHGTGLTTGGLVAFLFSLNLIYNHFNVVPRIYLTLQHSFAAADRIFNIIDLEPEVQDEPDAISMPTIMGIVEFSNVRFAYNKNLASVLQNINLEVTPGTVVALVGPSGAGKTTFVNLIPRFYDVTDGRILIDGKDVRDVKIASLREQMGIVPQETILFSTSIKENISYGKRNATMDEIVFAAKAANAHDFIMQLSNDYETVVGERGVTLSGGQRQRIAVARAILKNPRILILDEATSSVDSISETLIQEALEKLMKGRTTFVIAHRLSTIKNADIILVLENGQIVEQGKHEELYNLGGEYRKLYDLILVKEKEI